MREFQIWLQNLAWTTFDPYFDRKYTKIVEIAILVHFVEFLAIKI